MGHHLCRNMDKIRAALDALTPEKDGVDGANVYIYGEVCCVVVLLFTPPVHIHAYTCITLHDTLCGNQAGCMGHTTIEQST